MTSISSRWALSTLVLLLVGSLASCGDDDAPPVTPTDAGANDDASDGGPTACPPMDLLEAGDPNGHATPLTIPAGEARAGRLEESELPVDPTGLGTYRAGDFVLANERIAILVEDARESSLYNPFGGGVVGIAQVREGRLVDAADLNEIIPAIGRYILATTSVSVLSDGSDGGPAIIRAIGPLRPLPFIDEFAASIVPGEYRDVDAAIDYTLAPGAEEVDITFTFDVHRSTAVAVQTPLHAFFQRNRMQLFTPFDGFLPATAEVDYIGFAVEGMTSFGWYADDAPLRPFLEVSGFSTFTTPRFTLPACTRTVRPYGHLVVGGNGLDGLAQAMARVRGDTLREVTGFVRDSGGAPVAGAFVQALIGGKLSTRVKTGADGSYVLHAPSEPLELVVINAGDPPTTPRAVGASEATADIALLPAGLVHVRATEEGAPIPVRVQVFPEVAIPPTPPSFGLPKLRQENLYMVFPPTGEITLRVPVGRHRVVVSRGFEYDIVDRIVEVADGATVDVEAALERVIDTTDVLCADYHIHTRRSPDAVDPVLLKVQSIAGDGLDIAVQSEHEWVSSFEPVIAELGFQALVRGIGGLELTTFSYGHFGVFPLVPSSARNGGIFQWSRRLPREVFDEVRARPEAPALIINHPTGTGIGGAEAYFTAAGYDPVTGMVERPERWDDAFTLVEVFNEKSWEESRDASVRDWLGLLNHGRRVFAVGSSDSHEVPNGRPVGYPRTCLRIGTDDVRGITDDLVRDVTNRGESTIFGGIYVDARAVGNVGPGGQVTSSGARAPVEVTVQAASWIEPRALDVVVDGVVVETITIEPGMADPENPNLRMRGTIEIPVAEGAMGSYAIFVVHGEGNLAPVYPGRSPFGATNPIFFRR